MTVHTIKMYCILFFTQAMIYNLLFLWKKYSYCPQGWTGIITSVQAKLNNPSIQTRPRTVSLLLNYTLCLLFMPVTNREMQRSVFLLKSHITSINDGIIIDLYHFCGLLRWLFYSMVLPQRSDWTSSRSIRVVTQETTQERQAVLWCDFYMLRAAPLEGYGCFFLF